ncbi:MLP-like protein 165 [Raphanus sativus]|uniref:MLP-like protein 165 n=1 Tax=Raphanus sativus TaxID=3726 RepID=A0A6J0NXP4_RAPSA|nr:MLP-like protein 165 [Raphanus sativus]KAJ4897006.1 MLP-like protein 165 [Raphanus sativus]
MVTEEIEVDVEIKSPANMFHMFVGRLQHLPKATRYIQGCDLLEGDWGMVGSIVLWKLLFDGEEIVSKDMIEAMDFEKNVIQLRVLEGPLKTVYNSLLKTMKVSPNHGGPGSTVKWNVKYERIDENVAHPERQLQFLVEVTKQVDGYLLSEE